MITQDISLSKPNPNEWYTPAKYVDAAREAMGDIELDPASCALANETVRAARYYTIDEDGLMQDWACSTMWINPPYGQKRPALNKVECRYKGGGASPDRQSLQTMFINKAIEEYQAGNIGQVVLLVTANTTLKWFQRLWDYPMCTPYPKIGFTVPGSNEKQRQVFGNVFVYLGFNETKFIEIFSQLGTVTRRVTPTSPHA